MSVCLFLCNFVRVLQLQLFLWFSQRKKLGVKNIYIYSSNLNIFSDYTHWYVMIGEYTYELRKNNPRSSDTIADPVNMPRHNKHKINWWKIPYIPFIQYGFVGTTILDYTKIDEIYNALLLIDYSVYNSTNRSCQEFCNSLINKISDNALDSISDSKTTLFTVILPIILFFLFYIIYNYEKYYFEIQLLFLKLLK